MNLVHTGRADVGIVYRVDAIHNSGQVRIIDETPAGTYTRVQFGQAVVWTCRKDSLDVVQEFRDFMMSPRIQKLMLKYGLIPSHRMGDLTSPPKTTAVQNRSRPAASEVPQKRIGTMERSMYCLARKRSSMPSAKPTPALPSATSAGSSGEGHDVLLLEKEVTLIGA